MYDLAGVSGKSVLSHPEARRMMADVKRGHITGLVFSKLARLARSTKELLEISEFFQARDADLISLGESIDTSSPAGRLFYTIIAAMAQWEREEIAERVRASIPIRAAMGKRISSAPPFGYAWRNGQMVVDPAEAPVRRLIYELFSEHGRLRSVAKILNERGYRTRKGARFSDSTVERLITDPSAKGLRRANYTKTSADRKRVELKPESEWIMVPVEPIVSVELWEKCNAMLAARIKPERRPARKSVHLFSGLVLCQEDGAKMYPTEKRPLKYTCRTCRRTIRADDLEAIFVSQLRAFVFSPELIAENVEAADAALHENTELLEAARSQRARTAVEMDKLYRLYQGDRISPDGFKARNTPLEERLRQLDEQIPALQAEVDLRRIQLLSREEIVAEAQTLASQWEALEAGDRRTIVETITRRITVGESEVGIELEHLPPFDEAGVTWQRTPGSAEVRKCVRMMRISGEMTRARPDRCADPASLFVSWTRRKRSSSPPGSGIVCYESGNRVHAAGRITLTSSRGRPHGKLRLRQRLQAEGSIIRIARRQGDAPSLSPDSVLSLNPEGKTGRIPSADVRPRLQILRPATSCAQTGPGVGGLRMTSRSVQCAKDRSIRLHPGGGRR